MDKLRCDVCTREPDAAAHNAGWPIARLGDDLFVCPECYGDDAFCDSCGEVLPADNEQDICDRCEEGENALLR